MSRSTNGCQKIMNNLIVNSHPGDKHIVCTYAGAPKLGYSLPSRTFPPNDMESANAVMFIL